jgi:hypothetical protein
MRFPAVRVLAGALLALGFASMSAAQDELPKDAPPPPKPSLATPPAQEPEEPSVLPPGTMIDEPVAMLQALDKITARVKRLPIHVGQVGKFGTLSILVDACRKAPPEDSPESAAFLKITDGKSDAPQTVFSGWMFASSPALSALEHPVYDLVVLDCVNASGAPAADEAPAGDQSPASGDKAKPADKSKPADKQTAPAQ